MPDYISEIEGLWEMLFNICGFSGITLMIFHVVDKKVFVKFQKIKTDDFGPGNIPVLQTNRNSSLPFAYDYQYFIGHKKLFSTHIATGKKVSRAARYSKKKKFVLFGSHYYKRKWYLRKLH
ncbi:MAG TPA: hypothetical protein VK618_04585 [Flavitalea sp.]|nr:hypothetical protein [Flavitalea sp.]